MRNIVPTYLPFAPLSQGRTQVPPRLMYPGSGCHSEDHRQPSFALRPLLRLLQIKYAIQQDSDSLVDGIEKSDAPVMAGADADSANPGPENLFQYQVQVLRPPSSTASEGVCGKDL